MSRPTDAIPSSTVGTSSFLTGERGLQPRTPFNQRRSTWRTDHVPPDQPERYNPGCSCPLSCAARSPTTPTAPGRPLLIDRNGVIRSVIAEGAIRQPTMLDAASAGGRWNLLRVRHEQSGRHTDVRIRADCDYRCPGSKQATSHPEPSNKPSNKMVKCSLTQPLARSQKSCKSAPSYATRLRRLITGGSRTRRARD